MYKLYCERLHDKRHFQTCYCTFYWFHETITVVGLFLLFTKWQLYIMLYFNQLVSLFAQHIFFTFFSETTKQNNFHKVACTFSIYRAIPVGPDQLLLRGAMLRNTKWIFGRYKNSKQMWTIYCIFLLHITVISCC